MCTTGRLPALVSSSPVSIGSSFQVWPALAAPPYLYYRCSSQGSSLYLGHKNARGPLYLGHKGGRVGRMDSDARPQTESIPVPSGDGSSVDISGNGGISGPLESSPDADNVDPWLHVTALSSVIKQQGLSISAILEILQQQGLLLHSIAEALDEVSSDTDAIKDVHVKLLQSAEAFSNSPMAKMLGGSSIFGGNKDE